MSVRSWKEYRSVRSILLQLAVERLRREALLALDIFARRPIPPPHLITVGLGTLRVTIVWIAALRL
jgi:hypothetical protein